MVLIISHFIDEKPMTERYKQLPKVTTVGSGLAGFKSGILSLHMDCMYEFAETVRLILEF